MPLWRHPLDELIEDLERTLPPPVQSVERGIQPFGDFVIALHKVVRHGGEWARAQHDPVIQWFLADWDRAFGHGKGASSTPDKDPHGDPPPRDPVAPPADD